MTVVPSSSAPWPGAPAVVRATSARAAEQGIDAFISGEASEQTIHTAREMGMHFYAAGHHATERYGVKALGEWLATVHGLEVTFIDIDNPVWGRLAAQRRHRT